MPETTSNLEQAVTNLLVTVTEIKGDIKLILHQQETADKARQEQQKKVDAHDERLDKIDGAITRIQTTVNVLKYVFSGTLALAGAIAAILGIFSH